MKRILSFFMSFVKLVIIVLVIAGGWQVFKVFKGEGKAKIRNMTPGGLASGGFHCWMSLEFKEYPAGINLKDVSIVFSSIALENGTTSFDWNFIAQNAQVPKKVGSGRVRAENTSPDKDPPLNYCFDVNFPLVPKMRIESGESPWLKAELFWGGKKQDQSQASARFLYKRDY